MRKEGKCAPNSHTLPSDLCRIKNTCINLTSGSKGTGQQHYNLTYPQIPLQKVKVGLYHIGMKQISFNREIQVESLQVRSNREQLIADIVSATTEKDQKKLAKLISIRAREMKWSDTDLHALLKKKNDPGIRNYTAYVWWSIKIKTT